MDQLKSFGGEGRPLRASLLPLLMRCPMAGVLALLSDGEGSAGQAADTGSAVHMAARAFHTVAKGDVLDAIGVMRMGKDAFYPLADLDSAEQQFRRYAADPRNQGVELLLCEEKVKVELAPAEDDPTKEAVIVFGTVDQVRREQDGSLRVLDIKTGSMHEGPEMLHAHALQLMAYQLGAAARLGEPVRRAGVIRTKDYLKPRGPGPVFWEGNWYYRDAVATMASVARLVARIRRGDLEAIPSAESCRWCPQGGIANCAPRLKEMRAAA